MQEEATTPAAAPGRKCRSRKKTQCQSLAVLGQPLWRACCLGYQAVIKAAACWGRSSPSLTAMSMTLCPESRARWAISAATA